MQKQALELHAIARVAKFKGQEKLQTVMNTFIFSQFSHCPVIWMFHDRNLNTQINKIHEGALRIAFKDTSSKFEDLLMKAASVQGPEKSKTFFRYPLFLRITSLIMQHRCEISHVSPLFPYGKAPHLHASQFSSREIFYEITSVFLKTGMNLRNLPPAHSRGAVTVSELCFSRHSPKKSTVAATEIYKAKHDLNLKFMGEIFVERNISHNLRGKNHLSEPIPFTNAYSQKAIRYTAHKL